MQSSHNVFGVSMLYPCLEATDYQQPQVTPTSPHTSTCCSNHYTNRPTGLHYMFQCVSLSLQAVTRVLMRHYDHCDHLCCSHQRLSLPFSPPCVTFDTLLLQIHSKPFQIMFKHRMTWIHARVATLADTSCPHDVM